MDRWRSARNRRLVAVVVALALALTFAVPFLAAVAHAAPGRAGDDVASSTSGTGDDDAGAAADDPADDEAAGTVVLVGVSGLQWSDVRTLATPNLWDLSRTAGVGAIAARSAHGTACPADGWLAVSAGARLADLEVEDRTCRTLRDVFVDGDPVPGWDDYVRAAEEQPYAARPGLLGELLAAAEVPAVGVGPGAAVALADPSGTPVGTHVPLPVQADDLEPVVRDAIGTARLVVVDAGAVRDSGHATSRRAEAAPEPAPSPEAEPPALPGTESEPGGPDAVDALAEPTRQEQVRELDERIGAVLRATAGEDVTLLVLSLADSGRPRLQLAAATGPAPRGERYEGALLTSGTTRQAGVVQATDVTTTLLAGLGVPAPDAAVGAPIVPTEGPATATARTRLMEDVAAEALQVTRVSGAFLTRLVVAQAALFLAAAVLLTRAGRADRPPLRQALRTLRVVAVGLGAAPIASFMTGLVPWWRASSPTTGFWLALLAWTAVVAAVALLGPWRRQPLGPAGAVAAITVVVLVADSLLGSPLVVDSPMGAHRLMAARFYGLSNQAFALLAAAGPVLATVLAQPLLDAGRRRLAVWTVVAVGLVVTVVDGAPGLGSDFGGPPALVVGFAVLAMLVAGRRVNWRVLLLVVGVGAVVVVGFAALDWLRPAADRTHLGRFFATVVDGGLWDVVLRKLSVHLRVLTYWRYVVLAVGGALVTALVLVGPKPGKGTGLLRGRSPFIGLREAVPLVGPTVWAVAVTLGIGFAINDSGIIIPATGMAFAVPCLVAAAAQRRLEHPDEVARSEAEAEAGAAARAEAGAGGAADADAGAEAPASAPTTDA